MIWARLYWLFLHSAGYSYKSQNREITPEEKVAIKSFFSVWCKYLHCGICINHCEDYIKTKLDSIDSWTHTNDFWLFTVDFHNEVNRTTKKPELSLESAEQELITRILQNYKVTDMKTFPWTMQEFTHAVTLFLASFVAQTKMNIPTVISDMKMLMESLAYVMPFQFSSYEERTLRQLWQDSIATWDWKAIEDKPEAIFDVVKTMFSSFSTAQTEMMNGALLYLNKEGATLVQERLLQNKTEAPKDVPKEAPKEAPKEISSFPERWIFFLIAQIVGLLIIILCIRISMKEFVGKVEPGAQVPRKERVM
jgi:hypothetical protein